MERLTVRPASFFDACDFAGKSAWRRKVFAYQVAHCEAFVVERGAEKLALGMFWRHRARRVEFALAVLPAAQQHMTGLVRLAHLTIGRMMESGLLVFANVRESDARAQRMARLVGFRPGRLRNPAIWVFRRVTHVGYDRNADGQQCQEGGKAAARSGDGPKRGQCAPVVVGLG